MPVVDCSSELFTELGSLIDFVPLRVLRRTSNFLFPSLLLLRKRKLNQRTRLSGRKRRTVKERDRDHVLRINTHAYNKSSIADHRL